MPILVSFLFWFRVCATNNKGSSWFAQLVRCSCRSRHLLLFGPSYRPSAPGLPSIFFPNLNLNLRPSRFRELVVFRFCGTRSPSISARSRLVFCSLGARFRVCTVPLRLFGFDSIFLVPLFDLHAGFVRPAVFCFNPITPVSNPSVFFSVVFFVESFYFSNQIYCTFFNSKKQTAWMLSAKAILTDQAVKTKLLILTLRLLIISPFHTIFLCHFFFTTYFCSCSIFYILILHHIFFLLIYCYFVLVRFRF